MAYKLYKDAHTKQQVWSNLMCGCIKHYIVLFWSSDRYITYWYLEFVGNVQWLSEQSKCKPPLKLYRISLNVLVNCVKTNEHTYAYANKQARMFKINGCYLWKALDLLLLL
jgi:hypothetical protein